MGQDDSTETWTTADGAKLTLRHIAPGDAAKEQAFVQGLSQESSYLRFLGTIKDLSKKQLETFTHPDVRNAVALIVTHMGKTGEEEIGVARYVINPDRADCEFAIVVADAWQKHGIGEKLMNALIAHLQASKVKRISGIVLKRNASMLEFMKRLGFEESGVPDDSSIVSVTKQVMN
jgi:acetyltransferase